MKIGFNLFFLLKLIKKYKFLDNLVIIKVSYLK